MKKIMFSDKYGLTQAVLEGRKTMTRRIIPRDFFTLQWDENYDTLWCEDDMGDSIDIRDTRYAQYKVGEVVAIAQSYRDVAQGGYPVDSRYDAFRTANWGDGEDDALKNSAGWTNKMFVCADLMPHHIRITDVKVECLQYISGTEIIKEGIGYNIDAYTNLKHYMFPNGKGDFISHRSAFRDLIDRISGKGTWESNPWVFVYEFELVD